MILVDSTPLVAVVNPEDALHAAAIRDLATLRGFPLFVTLPVLTETCYLLPNASERTRLRTLLTQFNMRPVTEADDAGIRSDVLERMLKYAQHIPDWADAHIAVLCGRERRFKVWTYDREIWTTWRRPDGSRIPMAIRGSH